MSRYLITGAGGFLGYHLAKSLADDGHELVLFDIFLRGEPDQLFRDLIERQNVRFRENDLSLPEFSTHGIMGEFDVVFDFAALNGTQNFYDRPWDVLWNTTVPTLNVLDSLVREERCELFVYAGSSEAYAGTVSKFDWPLPTAEDVPLMVLDPTEPRWSYAASKILGEVATINACRDTDVDYLILRYHNVYGPRDAPGHVIPDFFTRALRGEFVIYGPEQTRSFMYVDDAIRATRMLVDTPKARNEIVNVGGEDEVCIGDLALQMIFTLGLDGASWNPLIECAPPPGSARRRTPDLSKLHRLIPDYRESVSLDEGLRCTLAYYRE